MVIMKAVCNEEHVKFLGDQTMAYDTTSLISNATNFSKGDENF